MSGRIRMVLCDAITLMMCFILFYSLFVIAALS